LRHHAKRKARTEVESYGLRLGGDDWRRETTNTGQPGGIVRQHLGVVSVLRIRTWQTRRDAVVQNVGITKIGNPPAHVRHDRAVFCTIVGQCVAVPPLVVTVRRSTRVWAIMLTAKIVSHFVRNGGEPNGTRPKFPRDNGSVCSRLKGAWASCVTCPKGGPCQPYGS
jgi:hypothetical protein